MNKYVVRYAFQKGQQQAVGTETVQAESDFMASKIAEGQARKKYNRDGWTFLVTAIERK